MNVVLIGFLTVFVFAAVNQNSLADNIYVEQKISLSKSPFKSAKGLLEGIETQKDFRDKYLNDIINLRKKNDTIIITEKYDFACTGCPAVFVEINLREQYIQYIMKRDNEKFGDYSSHTYKKADKINTIRDNAKSAYFHRDLQIITQEIRKGKDLNIDSHKYGTDYCYDDSQTMYTVIFPDNSIKCMYMRCWN